jgi:transposase-like protein
MTIEEVVRKVLHDEHADVIRDAVKAVAAEMMELEVSELIGAQRGERRSEDRATHRNGYRGRRGDARAGELELQIPELRQGGYLPSFHEPRKRSEQALLALVQQAYVLGVLRGGSISSSSGPGCGSPRATSAGSARRLMNLDAKMEKVRAGGRVVAKAPWSRTVFTRPGRREILSIDVGEAETETFWTEFLRERLKRGLSGVQLAISHAHAELKAAIAKVLGSSWQRCSVHFLRDCLGHARSDQYALLAAFIPPIFNAENHDQARDRLSEAVAHLDGRMPKVVALLEDVERRETTQSHSRNGRWSNPNRPQPSTPSPTREHPRITRPPGT